MARRKHGGEGRGSLSKLVERDLTALAREQKLPAAHGVDPAISEVLALLARGGKAPLLAGDPGVGKSAVVQEIARRIAAGLVDGALASARILEVPVMGVFARASSPKHAAEIFEALLEDLGRVEATIVYLRDVSALQGSSLAPVLLRALRAGRLRFVFEADGRQAQELLHADEAIAERVHLLLLQEPPADRARWILGQVAQELEEELRLAIEPGACDTALRLSSRFLLARRLPRKALELLREAAAEAAGAAKDRLTADDVLARFCAATRLPRFVVDDSIPLDLADTERFFGERLLGQNDAAAAVLRAVALLKAGLNDPRRPLGVFLFAGPTGVGKTHLAKLLAEYLFGSADRLVRLNMADYPDEGDELTVFGSPWGQTAAQKRGELTRLLEGKVFSVLLLDEFEKAHDACHDRFLQLFDEGKFINAAGETVPCSNTLMVATSNIGAEVYREPPLGFGASRSLEEMTAEVDRRIAERFRAEFLNRFDALCHFHPLGRVEIRRIAQREVGRVLERDGIRARGLDVDVAPEVVDLLVERGYSPVFGARFLQREIEKTLSAALAIEIARRPLATGTPVSVVARGGRVVALAEPRAQAARTEKLQLPGAGAQVVRKRLDQAELLAEASDLVSRAHAIAGAAGRGSLQESRARLLTASQAPDFWEDAARAATTLREFRGVEAKLTDLERLTKVCSFALRRAREAKAEAQLPAVARAVEEAAREVQLAKARFASGAGAEADEALLEICAASDSDAHQGWVAELFHMYRSWAERRGIEATPVAEGTHPARAVLRLQGPGVLGFLGGEHGLHRRLHDEEGRLGAFVRVHKVAAAPRAGRTLQVESRVVKKRAGALLDRVGAEVTARDDATGRRVELAGNEEPAQLSRLAATLLAGLAADAPLGEARRYHVGRAPRVEDPRTSAATPRLKDVLRGELDLFIAAWLSRPPAESEAAARPIG